MATFQTLNVQNNKFPCEGPRGVPIDLPFAANSLSFTVDISNLVTLGSITDIQALWLDNSGNNFGLKVVCDGLLQQLIIPAGYQAYVPVLLNSPKVTISTFGVPALKVSAIGLNFPVQYGMWPTQRANKAFWPSGTQTQIAVTTSSGNTAFSAGTNSVMRIVNLNTTQPVFFSIGKGAQTATTNNTALLPYESIYIEVRDYDNIAFIGASAGSVQVSLGHGGTGGA